MEEIFSADLLKTELDNLNNDYHKLEETHKHYLESLKKFTKLQVQCQKEIAHQQKRLKQLKEGKERLSSEGVEGELKKQIEELSTTRPQQIAKLEESLPRPSDAYLRIILDGVNVSVLDKESRYAFKEAYERFKLIVSALILFVAVLDLMFKYRAIDAVLHFLLVWYHCTLTIRESILIVNGSRIKGWWRTLQFLETILAGIIIVWPDGEHYDLFRTQFLLYRCYITFLQFLQCYYQQGVLYRLRTLGERYFMDITINGFHSWMWRGLSFLLPFLYIGYAFQCYNAWILYKLSKDCNDWQVPVSAALFFIIFCGNTLTTSAVVYQKLTEKISDRLRQLRSNADSGDEANPDEVSDNNPETTEGKSKDD